MLANSNNKIKLLRHKYVISAKIQSQQIRLNLRKSYKKTEITGFYPLQIPQYDEDTTIYFTFSRKTKYLNSSN